LALAAAPVAAGTKPIGMMSVAGLTSEAVPIIGVTWDAAQPGPQHSFAVTRIPDQASPLFFFRALLGTTAATAQIILSSKGNLPTTYDLTDVLLTSVSVQTDAKGQLTEVIQLQINRLAITAEGVSKCWDFAANIAC
jgi:type VI protein secretion system component Hcp